MNPLVRRALVENRGLAVTIGLALVANVLAYALVVRPLEVKSTGAADRAAAAANALRAAERERAQAEGLVAGRSGPTTNSMPSTRRCCRRISHRRAA